MWEMEPCIINHAVYAPTLSECIRSTECIQSASICTLALPLLTAIHGQRILFRLEDWRRSPYERPVNYMPWHAIWPCQQLITDKLHIAPASRAFDFLRSHVGGRLVNVWPHWSVMSNTQLHCTTLRVTNFGYHVILFYPAVNLRQYDSISKTLTKRR